MLHSVIEDKTHIPQRRVGPRSVITYPQYYLGTTIVFFGRRLRTGIILDFACQHKCVYCILSNRMKHGVVRFL